MDINQKTQQILKEVLVNGHKIDNTIEMLNYTTEFKNTKEILSLKARKLNYAFSIIEKFNFLSGYANPKLLMIYNKNLLQFFNKKEKKFDGDYAPRIGLQLGGIIRQLSIKPNTRQAVITIRNNNLDTYDTLDHPCTLSLQFLIRNDTLILITTMRSNDAYISLAGYDIINFTFILNFVANRLNIKKTKYFHNVGSLHIYENDIKKVKKLIISNDTIDLKINNDFKGDMTDVISFFNAEMKLRKYGIVSGNDTYKNEIQILNEFWEKQSKYTEKRYKKLYNFFKKWFETEYNFDKIITSDLDNIDSIENKYKYLLGFFKSGEWYNYKIN